jgi:hypothetical protein
MTRSEAVARYVAANRAFSWAWGVYWLATSENAVVPIQRAAMQNVLRGLSEELDEAQDALDLWY